MIPPEEWAPIPWPAGLPEGVTPPYEASSHGRIRSVLRTLADGRTCGGTILQQRDHNRPKDGPPFYQRVNLSHAGRKDSGRLVHQLVLLAFEGPPPPGKPLIRHLDDNPARNYWAPGGEGNGTNLVYGSEPENIADRVRREREAAARQADLDVRYEVHVLDEETNLVLRTQQRAAHTPSPRRGWLRHLCRRYTPWSRQRRAARKRGSDRQECDR